MPRALATLALSVAGLVFLAGCPDGHDPHHHHDYDQRPDNRGGGDGGGGDNWDRDRYERDASGWELIGKRSADDKRDSDSFDVGRSEGRFSRVKIQCRGGELVMYKMVVRFKDGTTFAPKLEHHFSNREASRTIDLPGDRRVIDKVILNYRGVRGKPELFVYAR